MIAAETGHIVLAMVVLFAILVIDVAWEWLKGRGS